MYNIRKTCVCCSQQLTNGTELFEKDYNAIVGQHYHDVSIDMIFVNYNVYKCHNCNTVQNKYLVTPNILYSSQHVDTYGTTWKKLCYSFSNFVKTNTNYECEITEIGSGSGFLCDQLQSEFKYKNYTIIDPQYKGRTDNRTIYNMIYEEYAKKFSSNFDVVIISHLFEHLYEPNEFIKSLSNKGTKHILMCHPNFDKYIENLHNNILNVEHTFFVNNDFLINWFNNNGFNLVDSNFYSDHSIMFHFASNPQPNPQSSILINNLNLFEKYMMKLKQNIKKLDSIVTNHNTIYMWPASYYSIQYITYLEPEKIKKIVLIDNSPLKHGKYLYSIPVKLLTYYIDNNNNEPLLLFKCAFLNEMLDQISKLNMKINYTIL